MTPGQLRELPKVELHCHLDGCVRVQTVAEIGRELGLALPEPLETALVAPERCENLLDYISRSSSLFRSCSALGTSLASPAN